VNQPSHQPFEFRLARQAAVTGGLLLMVAMITTVASVVSNALFSRPILGDTEIVEALMGAAVAAFLPWCQVRGANVIVDFFTMKLSARVTSAIDAVAYVVFATVAAVLTWRLVDGTITQFERERISMFLKIPIWWSYALATLACVLWVWVCIRTAWDRARFAAGHDG